MPGTAAKLRHLLKRTEFLRAARGNRAGRSAFLLQAIESGGDGPGIGYTVTKKTGNSPERSRIKRRLREAARACQSGFKPRHDYVLVGRREALSVPFSQLVADINSAVAKVHSTKIHASRAQGPRDDA
ncbi:MAG TPA: ribonuclease P protein component [Devosia sp.]|nr:ribonuclease P protein component [Devosia sp.]